MSETLWARCIRRAASEALIETQREEADNRQALWGQWKSHVSTWAFPDPGVKDVKFHNAMITRQNLNKPVILTSLLSTSSGKWLMSGFLECVYGRLSTWQNHRQIYELLWQVTSKVMLISSEEAAAVCVLSPSSWYWIQQKEMCLIPQRPQGLFSQFPTTCYSHPVSVLPSSSVVPSGMPPFRSWEKFMLLHQRWTHSICKPLTMTMEATELRTDIGIGKLLFVFHVRLIHFSCTLHLFIVSLHLPSPIPSQRTTALVQNETPSLSSV